MIPYVLIGAYWPADAQPRDACAERLVEVFNFLGKYDGLNQFYWQANSKEESLARPLAIDADSLSIWLESSRSRGKRLPVDSKLGWSNACWNGASDEAWAEVRVRCGVSVETLGNAFTIKIGSDIFRRLHDGGKEVLCSLVEIFDPASALVTSPELMEGIDMQPGDVGVGSISYFSSKFSTGAPVVSGVPFRNGVIVNFDMDLSVELSPVKLKLVRQLFSLLNS